MKDNYKHGVTVTMPLKIFQDLEQKANNFISREDLAREIEDDFFMAMSHDLKILRDAEDIDENVFNLIKERLGLK